MYLKRIKAEVKKAMPKIVNGQIVFLEPDGQGEEVSLAQGYIVIPEGLKDVPFAGGWPQIVNFREKVLNTRRIEDGVEAMIFSLTGHQGFEYVSLHLVKGQWWVVEWPSKSDYNPLIARAGL